MNLRSRRQRAATRGTRCGWYIRQWEKHKVERTFSGIGEILKELNRRVFDRAEWASD